MISNLRFTGLLLLLFSTSKENLQQQQSLQPKLKGQGYELSILNTRGAIQMGHHISRNISSCQRVMLESMQKDSKIQTYSQSDNLVNHIINQIQTAFLVWTENYGVFGNSYCSSAHHHNQGPSWQLHCWNKASC